MSHSALEDSLLPVTLNREYEIRGIDISGGERGWIKERERTTSGVGRRLYKRNWNAFGLHIACKYCRKKIHRAPGNILRKILHDMRTRDSNKVKTTKRICKLWGFLWSTCHRSCPSSSEIRFFFCEGEGASYKTYMS